MKHIRPTRLAAVLACIMTGLLACANVGTQVQDFEVAIHPNGARAEINAVPGIISGELLAVQNDGVIVLTSSVMQLVPYSSIRSMKLYQLGGDYSLGDQAPDAAQRKRLASVSRYPQGIDAQLRQQLLAKLGQQQIHVAR